jgi:hypothetical protein
MKSIILGYTITDISKASVPDREIIKGGQHATHQLRKCLSRSDAFLTIKRSQFIGAFGLIFCESLLSFPRRQNIFT